MSKFGKFFGLEPRLRLLLIEACINLGYSRLLLATTEFKKIAPKLGRHMQEVSAEAGGSQLPAVRQIGWAIRVMSKHTLWESKCFAQAIAAKRMLARRGIRSTLYLGTALDENGKLVAHAWIKSCGLTVTGGNTERYTVVSVFGS